MARPVAQRGTGRRRVIDAALALFAEHGVSGTSLQMIADSLGVTKAAVYFQFRSKDDIVLAVVEDAVASIVDFLDTAERTPDRAEQLELALAGLCDVAVEHGQAAAVLMQDRTLAHLMEHHEPLRSVTERLAALLLGEEPSARTRVATAVVARGMLLARSDPDLADVDDDVLRAELLAVARTALGLRARRTARSR